MKRYAVLTVGILLMATGAFAQSTATASANAQIVAAITVTNAGDLDFGAIFPSAAGNVIVDTTGGRSTTGPTLISGGTVSAAAFTVSGTSGYNYTFTIDDTVSISNGTVNMTVDLTTVGGDNADSGTFGAVASTHNVGGILIVGLAQAAGNYVGTFNVSAAYN